MNMKKITVTTLVMTMLIAAVIPLSGQAALNSGKLTIPGSEDGILPSLLINAPSSVIEGQNFLVMVMDSNNMSVDHAFVTFIYPDGQQSGYTYNGSISFTAPIYNGSSSNITGTITAEKEGYEPATVEIEIMSMEAMLVISAPPSVREGEHFWVYVTDGYENPMNDALVTFRYYGGQQSGYTYNGSISFIAPIYNGSSENWTRGSITAEKEGYLPATVEIEIILNECVLVINAPQSVPEGTVFQVFVANGNGIPVDDVRIFFADQVEYTHNGTATLTAPMVEQDTSYCINASKEGYEDASVRILVEDTSNDLLIDAPSSVLEGETFLVRVTDINGNLVFGAIVIFWNQTYDTQNGSVLILAPEVEDTTGALILARAFEYSPAEKLITIVDRSDQLVIHAPYSVLEEDVFGVTVTDANNILLEGVRVIFMNMSYYTDENGSVLLTAPMVDETITEPIYAWQFEYFGAEAQIIIINVEDQLVIHAPSSVMEGEMFLVEVTTVNGTLLSNVTLTFWNHTFNLPHGQILLLAPMVDDTLSTTIHAQKEGYLPAMVWITILNQGNITLGDVNGDGYANFGDINPFVYALTHTEAQFNAEYPQGEYWAADCNQDGRVDFGDINPFVEILTG